MSQFDEISKADTPPPPGLTTPPVPVQVSLRGAWGDTDTTADPWSQTAVGTHREKTDYSCARSLGAAHARAERCLSPHSPAQTAAPLIPAPKLTWVL